MRFPNFDSEAYMVAVDRGVASRSSEQRPDGIDPPTFARYMAFVGVILPGGRMVIAHEGGYVFFDSEAP